MSDPRERLDRSLAALRLAAIVALARRRGIAASAPQLLAASTRPAPIAEVMADLEAADSGLLRHAAYRLRKRSRRLAGAMHASAIGRFLSRMKRVFGAALLALFLITPPTAAQQGDAGMAAKLLAEALAFWAAAGPGSADDLPGLRAREKKLVAAKEKLGLVLREHSASAIARDLAAGREFHGLSLRKLETGLAETRLRMTAEEDASIRALERALDDQFARFFGMPRPNRDPQVASARVLPRDCDECPEMVVVPLGSLVMGAAPGEEEEEAMDPGDRGRSSPQLRVRISRSFAIGRFEVTRGEYAAFARETGEVMPPSCVVVDGDGMRAQVGRSWHEPGFEQDDRHPVVCVSWNDAQRYAAWLTHRTGKPYRLPSEAEWEYAARGGIDWPRPWAGGRDVSCEHANILDRSGMRALRNLVVSGSATCDDGAVFTSRVGSFRANAYGLHDMIGNAWEWVADCWSSSLAEAAILSGQSCVARSMRGGAWLTFPRDARPAFRAGYPAAARAAHIGFRVAREM